MSVLEPLGGPVLNESPSPHAFGIPCLRPVKFQKEPCFLHSHWLYLELPSLQSVAALDGLISLPTLSVSCSTWFGDVSFSCFCLLPSSQLMLLSANYLSQSLLSANVTPPPPFFVLPVLAFISGILWIIFSLTIFLPFPLSLFLSVSSFSGFIHVVVCPILTRCHIGSSCLICLCQVHKGWRVKCQEC